MLRLLRVKGIDFVKDIECSHDSPSVPDGARTLSIFKSATLCILNEGHLGFKVTFGRPFVEQRSCQIKCSNRLVR